MADVTESDVLEVLTQDGLSPADHLLVQVGDTDHYFPFVWNPNCGPMGCIIEDDDLAAACEAYLKRSGARRFRTYAALLEAARHERWPGWERHPQSDAEGVEDAEIVRHLGGFRWRVRFGDGREADSVVPRSIAREMFRIAPGDRVRVGGREPRILGFARRAE
jgi:translation initiation factor IF-1